MTVVAGTALASACSFNDLDSLKSSRVGLDGGAEAGEAGSQTAPSFVPHMTAVYLFEDVAALGWDSSPNGLHLFEKGQLLRDAQEFAEGSSALLLEGEVDTGLESLDPMFMPGATSGMTFGGWFRVEAVGNTPRAMGRLDNSRGYALEWNPGGANSRCIVGAGAGTKGAYAPSWESAQWVHVVCRWDAEQSKMASFIDGALGDTNGVPDPTDGMGPFRVSNPSKPYSGHIDELFLSRQPLSDEVILKIWACGIEGRLCLCDSSMPAEYAHCGRLAPKCDLLPPCDKAL